jgi:tetratricopeptide (TPR) repeat protein
MLFVFLTVLIGCSQGFISQGDQALKNQNYQQASAYYEQALRQHPDNPHVQHALGQVHFHLGEYDRAEELLKAAQTKIPKDGTVVLYLGLIAEHRNDYADAAALYAKYLAENKKSPLESQIKGRLLYVKDNQLRQQVADAIKNEKEQAADTLLTGTVGVMPFSVPPKASENVTSLATGMAATLWYDLSSVKGLQVVERLQVKYLTDELAAADKGFVAKNSGPRLGKIVRAKNLISGNLDSPSVDKLSLQSGVVNTNAGTYSPAFSADEKFSQAMKLQKEMTLAVLDSLGVKVGGSARRALKKPPTESYDAFLAFSRGIEQYDRGEYGKADAFFIEAVRLDPSFDLASELHREAQMMQVAAVDLQKFGQIVLAGTSMKQNGNDKLGSELLEISGSDTDPRHDDLPTTTGGTGSATVTGTIR